MKRIFFAVFCLVTAFAFSENSRYILNEEFLASGDWASEGFDKNTNGYSFIFDEKGKCVFKRMRKSDVVTRTGTYKIVDGKVNIYDDRKRLNYRGGIIFEDYSNYINAVAMSFDNYDEFKKGKIRIKVFNKKTFIDKGKRVTCNGKEITYVYVNARTNTKAQIMESSASSSPVLLVNLWNEKKNEFELSSFLPPNKPVLVVAKTNERYEFNSKEDFWYLVCFTDENPDVSKLTYGWMYGQYLIIQ
jgi:hypothetical protein